MNPTGTMTPDVHCDLPSPEQIAREAARIKAANLKRMAELPYVDYPKYRKHGGIREYITHRVSGAMRFEAR